MQVLPNRAGVSLKAEHYNFIIEQEPDIGWFEVHPENYMGAGGPPHKYLSKIRALYALSVHGVGLSIGAADRLDKRHLERLKQVIDRYEPQSFSEHLAWSSHRGRYFNDLLAAPYTRQTLQTVCDHIDEIQNTIGRTMLLENPATYISFENSVIEEIDFLSSVVKATGCGLLLDVNNVFVSCTNHDRDPHDYIKRFPHQHVGEIHLAGHGEDYDDADKKILIDAHDREICDEVWELYELALQVGGQVPTLIEWDNDIPAWEVLYAQAQLAQTRLLASSARTTKIRLDETGEMADEK